MPTKFLKPKNMRRGLLALLLAAPLVYMFGSLFFALNGAHEGAPFGQNQVETVYQFDAGMSTGISINPVNGQEVISSSTGATDYIQLTGYDRIRSLYYSNFYFYDSDKSYIGRVSQGTTQMSHLIPFNAEYVRITISPGASILLVTLFDVFIENQSSDYLFGQFFAKDNWVSSLGEKAVNNEIGIGLPFVGDLISYIDENAMPLSNSAYGYFIWGYSSYILNVLAIYMVVSIAASLVLIPMKVVDSLEERING